MQEHVGASAAGDAASQAGSKQAGGKCVRHLRQILLWPLQLLPLDENSPIQNHWELLAEPGPDNPWRQVDDEFGSPEEFQERHYNEFVTFLPPVQRFLYGQGLGKSVQKIYGESPIKVMRRTDVCGMRVQVERTSAPVDLTIKHVDLYFFFDIDVAVLVVEVFAEDLPFDTAQEILFRLGRAYPAYWDGSGRGGHCPYRVAWLDGAGRELAVSDYEKREKYLSFVCQHRAPAVSGHWEFIMSPLVLHHSDGRGLIRYRQLEYYRMPYMAFLALDNPHLLSRADQVRLALGSPAGDPDVLPYSHAFLTDFEQKHCYDRYSDGESAGARFMTAGHTMIAIGEKRDAFFMDADGGLLGRFRHQHFLLFLIAHFQRATLRLFSDRSVAAVSKLDLSDSRANRIFRRDTRFALENFLRFEHRYWFHEISNQAQTRDLFALLQQHLNLDALYQEVREELQDMGNFLEVEAMRRQNDSMVRLTVVTTFGLIGTFTTGFLGMNILAWAEQPVEWRAMAYLVVMCLTSLMVGYAVWKSRRLSEFLEALADEDLGLWSKIKAFFRIWSWRRRRS